MNAVNLFTTGLIDEYCSARAGETKVGQKIVLPESSDWPVWLADQKAGFVILGVPEDIGVRANGGLGGAATAWDGFLKAFLNIQDNEFFNSEDIVLLGTLDTGALMEKYTPDASAATLREGTTALDELLWPVVEAIVGAGKVPILIGGGHNNAYPLLKGLSLATGQAVNVINLDAHADFRALEGRHSGNGFSYAYAGGFLKKYSALGLHHAYNNADIVREFTGNADLKAIWFEEIYLQQRIGFAAALQKSIEHVQEQYFGVELDLDCIQDTLSSAQSPFGFSRAEAWQYVFACGRRARSRYLHLTEAVTVRADGLQYPMTGKLLSYLVQAFVKGKKELVGQGGDDNYSLTEITDAR